MKAPTITLKLGDQRLPGALGLAPGRAWAVVGQRARRSATLTMFTAEGKPVVKYWMVKAWPKSMDLAGLKAGAGEGLIETAVFACETIQRVAP